MSPCPSPIPRCLSPLALAFLALAACASQPQVRGEPAQASGPGWFALPRALSTKPQDLPIRPLEFRVPEPRQLTLKNGLKVFLREDRSVPLVTAELLVVAGSMDDPQGKEGLAALMSAAMRIGGAGERGAAQLDELVDFQAMELGATALEEHTDLYVNARSADFKLALSVLSDMVLRPRFQADRVEHLKQRAEEGLRRRVDDPSGLAYRALTKAVYGTQSPFGREMSLASLRSITREDLSAFHRRAFVPQTSRLVLSGDYDSGTIAAELEQTLGAWKPGPAMDRSFKEAPRPGKREVIIVAKPSAQAKVRMGHLGFRRHDPKEHAYRLLEAALGNAPGPTRLSLSLREESGLAYSAYASIGPGADAGLFLVGADTRPEQVSELIRRALAVLDGLRGPSPIEGDELTRAKEVLTNAFAFRFETARRAAYEVALHDFYAYPADYLQTYREKVAALSTSQLSAATGIAIRPDELRIVVVGDPKAIGDLSAFGPVRVIKDLQNLE